jgi:putative tricarboxylic transport membrane protein
MGLFGIAEVLFTVGRKEAPAAVKKVKLRELLPTPAEWKRSIRPIFRGSILGFLIGLVPGPSPIISTFVSYFTEKKLSKKPEEFGDGAIEGVAGPEAANNAAVGGAYVPLFALGIPFTPAMAMVLGALMLHGLTPGPNLIKEKSDLFWTVIASMYIGNFMLIVLNLPLVNVFVNILRVPQRILMPVIVLVCMVGVYSVNASTLDLLLLAVFGLVGYALRRAGFQVAPLILALVIGPVLETSLRQALHISGGDLWAVVLTPISIALYMVTALVFGLPPLVKAIRGRLSARHAPAGVG